MESYSSSSLSMSEGKMSKISYVMLNKDKPVNGTTIISKNIEMHYSDIYNFVEYITDLYRYDKPDPSGFFKNANDSLLSASGIDFIANCIFKSSTYTCSGLETNYTVMFTIDKKTTTYCYGESKIQSFNWVGFEVEYESESEDEPEIEDDDKMTQAEKLFAMSSLGS